MHGGNSLARLYVNLSNALKEKQDIFPILRDASKEDFLNIFAIKRKYQNKEQKQVEATLFGNHLTLHVFGDILKAAKHHMILKEVLNKELRLILEGEHEDNKEIHTSETFFKMMDFVVGSGKKDMLEVLETIQKSCELESFWKASSEVDRNMIKGALEREKNAMGDDQEGQYKCQCFLRKIDLIEKAMKAESKPIKTIRTPSTGVVFGCSIAVGLVVGLGFFAAGIPLGYASMAGFMAGIGTFAVIASAIAITSTVCCLLEESKPSKDLNKVDAAQHAAAGADLQHN